MSLNDRGNFGERKQSEHSEVILDVRIRKGFQELGVISLRAPFTTAKRVDVPGRARRVWLDSRRARWHCRQICRFSRRTQ